MLAIVSCVIVICTFSSPAPHSHTQHTAETYFSNFFGIIVWDGAPVTVDLKVYGEQVRYFESLPLHNSQKVVEANPDYTVFRYIIIPTYDFCQEILRYGADVEVLAPESLRNEIRADIEAMSARYK